MGKWQAIFSKDMLKQFRKLASNAEIKQTLHNMLDDLETIGPSTGKILDSQLHLYELKRGKPSIRLYYRPRVQEKKIDVFACEIKKSATRQKKLINQLRKKTLKILSLLL